MPMAQRKRGRKLPAGITERTSKATGATNYQVRLRRVGMPTNTHTFETLREAEAWKAYAETKRNRGERVATHADRRATIVDAIGAYISQGKTIDKKEAQRLDFLSQEFAGLAMMLLTAPMLQAWCDKMSVSTIPQQATKKRAHPLYDGDTERIYSPATIRKYFYTLKKVLEWYSAFFKQTFDSPFAQVALPSEDNWRNRRLEDGEEARLLKACNKMTANKDAIKRVILFALETAMRAGEILKLEWHEVDFKNRRIIIPAHKCKTRRQREVPMTTPCIEILKSHEKATRSDKQTRVFYQWPDSNALGHRFKTITKNASLEDFVFHDLRHEATSRFYERTKLSDIEIATITGHTDLKTLKRYANLRANNLAEKLW